MRGVARLCLGAVALMALTIALCGAAAAEPVHLARQDLYMNAMQSIAEGRQDEATDALARIIDQAPENAGAWLDLAITQCELGNTAEAERLFATIESRFAPPPGILEVIAGHRERGCAGRQPRNRMSFTVGRGIDDNVNQGASSPNFSLGSGTGRIDLILLPEYLPQQDQFTLLAGEYLHELSPNGSVGFVQVRARQNDSVSRYNTTSVRAGLERPWRFGDWEVRGMGAFSLLTLGNQLYQRQGQVQVRVAPPLRLPDRFRFSIVSGLSRVEYPTVGNFNANTTELGGLLTYEGERAQAQASIGHLSDRGAAARLGGNRTGWFASLQGQARLGEKMVGELGWSRQNWLNQAPYSPGLIDQVRRQDTELVRAALTIPLQPRHSLQFEWRKVKNHENISIFQYNSQLLQVSWQRQLF